MCYFSSEPWGPPTGNRCKTEAQGGWSQLPTASTSHPWEYINQGHKLHVTHKALFGGPQKPFCNHHQQQLLLLQQLFNLPAMLFQLLQATFKTALPPHCLPISPEAQSCPFLLYSVPEVQWAQRSRVTLCACTLEFLPQHLRHKEGRECEEKAT